ncbi:MAG: MerR family transcriptional regulator [Candidatus Atribacteria bacterium]|nr:MerR family transcriptional regulator [Candidatus Atribacteria bacterium]
MEYTIKRLAEISGVSRRTLRYYDEVGLLKPVRSLSSGYRIYSQKEVERLQQILFYRALGVSLRDIHRIITLPNFNEIESLKEHHKKLLEKERQIHLLIRNVEKTIETKERKRTMSDKEKFEGFKKNLVDENERKYGQEIRQLYGNDIVEKSNEKLKKMNQEDYETAKKIDNELMSTLKEAMQNGNPASEIAQKAADLHRQWLSFYWSHYSKVAHAELVRMYVTDHRFSDFYDQKQLGTAKFLRDAVLVYTGKIKGKN